ncbi:methyl-accepting chemotaxis protein [Salipiger mangrovisoli]|uniref:Methyl-accepting transducer domain-containing protein n=1 Tax=Salipiger mangrovisoli TaxID=2865933 RepID=A0ABR9WXY4_9RHOB|nr:methyl-accepting chemotaxis protein [Salipiger mangrovisoli]MBE9636154.1 hypothetical protein [Salipiger mangrovisoli]
MHPAIPGSWSDEKKRQGAALHGVIAPGFDPMIRRVYAAALNIAPEDVPAETVAVERQKFGFILRGEFSREYAAVQAGIARNLIEAGLDYPAYMIGYAHYQAGILGLVMGCTTPLPIDLPTATALVQLATMCDAAVTIDHFFAAQAARAAQDRDALLDRLFTGIGSDTGALETMAAELRQTFDSLSERTMTQAASLEENTASLTELTEAVADTARNARDSARSAELADQRVRGAQDEVRRTRDAIAEVDESTGQIRNFVNVIDKIALQTKLLALNASVEAARAEDYGRGFGVVATEVRALAEQTTTAAGEVAATIKEIVSRVQIISQRSDRMDTSLAELVATMAALVAGFARIEQATGEQSDSVSQVGSVQQQLDTITQENAAAVSRAADHMRALQARVAAINSKISEFQTETVAGRSSSAGPLPPQPAPRRSGAGGQAAA